MKLTKTEAKVVKMVKSEGMVDVGILLDTFSPKTIHTLFNKEVLVHWVNFKGEKTKYAVVNINLNI